MTALRLLGTSVARRVELTGSKLLSGMSVPVQVFGTPALTSGRLALRRPASKKRQGTKSRDVWGAAGQPALWVFDVVAVFVAGATLGRGDLHAWTQGGRERENAVSAGAWSVSTGAGCIDRGELSRARSPPAWSQRNGTGKGRALGGGLAHDVSIVLGVGRHLGSQPRAKTSMTIMRAPQRGHGQGNTRGASGAISDCGCGSAAGGSAPSSARAVAMFSARLALAN